MNPSPPESPGFRWSPYVVLAFVALWPTVGPAEAVLSLGALTSLAILAHRRFRNGTALLSREAWALITALFFCYWLPEAFSAIDAEDTARAWREVLLDLRYLPFLWLVAMAVATARGRRIVFLGLGLIAGAWALDAAVQAVTGFSLGGANSSDRLSGIFGAGNLKLGLVLATLSPFALDAAARRFHASGWFAAAMLLGSVILLAGSTASLDVREYPPAEIKKAITGTGSATKEQVQFMVAKLLRLKSAPQPADAADGVAAALTACLSTALPRIPASRIPLPRLA